MKSSALTSLVVASLAASASASAQECPRPVPRPLIALQTATSQDESMAQAFDLAAAGCIHEDLTCDDARTRCGESLTQTLQKQLSFDEGAFLRDMLIAYQGQQYRMATPIPSAAPLTDVSCNADGVTLKAAAARRHSQAERRKLMLAEYPRWTTWVLQQYQLCQDRGAADKVRVDAQAADAARLLAAAQLAKQAEEVKVDQARAAERAAKDRSDAAAKASVEKAAADARAKEEALAQQKAAQLAAQKQREAAEAAALERVEEDKKAALERADAEKRAKESAEETAARQRKEAEEAKLVGDRESRKESAKLKQAELIEKEKVRQDEVNLRHEQARKNAEAAHVKKIEELKRSLELSEADKAAQVAEVDKQYEEAEVARREAAHKEIDAAGIVDHSDERLIGALCGHGAGGYLTMGASAGAALAGAQLSIRQGFWSTAPAEGMASGGELRATVLFLTAVSGTGTLIQVSPEFRYWFGRFGIGAAGEYQNLKYGTAATQNPATFALGPTLSLAAVDSPDARVFFTVRYLPIVVAGGDLQFERITGEIEGGYAIFSFAVQGGVLKDSTTKASTLTGWFVGGCAGVRLRW